jgi:hypothetical protein
MGGSGGNGSPPEQPPRRPDFPDCESMRFETVIVSPQQVVIATLHVGDVLRLQLGSQQNRPVVDVVTNAGTRAGSITSTHLTQLIACLQGGHDYLVEVRDLNGGACRVLVHHANR